MPDGRRNLRLDSAGGIGIDAHRANVVSALGIVPVLACIRQAEAQRQCSQKGEAPNVIR